jgi:thymidylate synthase (FAD)
MNTTPLRSKERVSVIKAEYIEHMGSDLRVVNSARVSFSKESEWYIPEDAQKMGYSVNLKLKEEDKKLIIYLAKHNHWTPFSHPQITMRESVPIFVARQRFKHMVGFTYNEESRRYIDSKPSFYTPEVWRKRADKVKQGSSNEPVDEPLYIRNMYTPRTTDDTYKRYLEYAQDLYNDLLENGTCPEQARMVLPQSMITSYYVTGSLAAWARAYKQRIDLHAQKEIRDLAAQWGEIIEPLFPVSWEALVG